MPELKKQVLKKEVFNLERTIMRSGVITKFVKKYPDVPYKHCLRIIITQDFFSSFLFHKNVCKFSKKS